MDNKIMVAECFVYLWR